LDAVTVRALRQQEEIHAQQKNGFGKQKEKSINAKPGSASPSTSATGSSTSTTSPPASTPSSITTSQPQYRYTTPIEDPAITQSVDTPFSITLQELYLTSPDVRKFLKDQITTWHIPVGQSATVSVEDVPEDNDPPVSSFVYQYPYSSSVIVTNQIEDL
jgi:hypothetical protein